MTASPTSPTCSRSRPGCSNPNTFLYNTGPILSLDSPNWNRRQFYTVTRIDDSGQQVLGSGLASPPCNIGPLSTPHYAHLAAAAVHELPHGGGRVFAGQRAEGFYVDLGAIFDLGNLRPFEELHNQFGMHVFGQPAPGSTTDEKNVHSIALKVPISQLVAVPAGSPVIGVWTTASRQNVRLLDSGQARPTDLGPWRQVSRLGNPLFNEVIVPMGKKDLWNTLPPGRRQELRLLRHPARAWPGCFRCSTRGCSRTWPRWSRRASPGRIWRPSC